MTALPTAALGSTLANIGAGLRAISCELCERCLDRDRVSVASDDDLLCDDCRDAKAEAAYERSCEAYYGGSTPQTFAERAAANERDALEEMR